MIKKIRVRNFRSLRDVELHLGGRNILIGPNKSGKTSLLDAFSFLAQAVFLGDIGKALDQRGGLVSVLWKGEQRLSDVLGPAFNVIEWEIQGEVAGREATKFTYLLAISGDLAGSRVFVKREVLDVVTGETTGRLIDMQDGEGVAKRLDGSQLFSVAEDKRKPALSYDIPGWEAQLVKNTISLWHFYDLIPQLATPVSASAAAVSSLDVHGTNLTSWIHTIQVNHPDEFQRIVKLMCDAFPEIESLQSIVTQAGTTFITSREKHLQSPIAPLHFSSGERKFLALASLIYSPFGGSLLCIEEPENHLHPRLLSRWVEIEDQRRRELAGRAAQLVVTTHSPYLVDLLEPEDIVLVEKREGTTQCRRPSSGDELRRLIREAETTLGRLWFTGSLGAV